MELKFKVRSSSSDSIYDVYIRKEGVNLTAICNCPAGQNNMSCKHRENIFCGDISSVISGDIEKLNIIGDLLDGTDVKFALREIELLTQELEHTKNLIKVARRKLGEVLSD